MENDGWEDDIKEYLWFKADLKIAQNRQTMLDGGTDKVVQIIIASADVVLVF